MKTERIPESDFEIREDKTDADDRVWDVYEHVISGCADKLPGDNDWLETFWSYAEANAYVQGLKRMQEFWTCWARYQDDTLDELVSRFIKYDEARDKYVDFLQKELTKAGVDYERLPRWDKLHMAQDEKFCQCRWICREVRNDPTLMEC